MVQQDQYFSSGWVHKLSFENNGTDMIERMWVNRGTNGGQGCVYRRFLAACFT